VVCVLNYSKPKLYHCTPILYTKSQIKLKPLRLMFCLPKVGGNTQVQATNLILKTSHRSSHMSYYESYYNFMPHAKFQVGTYSQVNRSSHGFTYSLKSQSRVNTKSFYISIPESSLYLYQGSGHKPHNLLNPFLIAKLTSLRLKVSKVFLCRIGRAVFDQVPTAKIELCS
jgi:hypothetical protein